MMQFIGVTLVWLLVATIFKKECQASESVIDSSPTAYNSNSRDQFSDDIVQNEFELLKREAQHLDEHQMRKRLKRLRQLRLEKVAQQSKINEEEKVDHAVVLLMENRAFDHMMGCLDIPGIDGVPPGGHSIPVDPTDRSKGNVTMSCGTANHICPRGPHYSTFSPKFPPHSNSHTYPYDEQSDSNSYANGAQKGSEAITAFSPDQVPIKDALSKHFSIFNNYYSAVPAASTPNHLMLQSATSCGLIENIRYSDCGGPSATFPQMTIYDSLFINNRTFGWYMNSTCGIDGHPSCHGIDPNDPDAGSPIDTPDVAMSGVGRYKNRFFSQKLFYDHAANGSLPHLSWVLPPLNASDHPCRDVAMGERLIKDIYEALRAGPSWNSTLFFVVYDDAGGFYDHVVPPFEGVPSDDAPCHLDNECTRKFDFRRLGLRTTALLISPLVPKGAVFKKPKDGPTSTSQFDHTSIPASLKNIFNLTGFLTKRDMWAGSVHSLLLDEPRTDTPWHLPDVLPTKSYSTDSENENIPQHCSQQTGQCLGPQTSTQKQRNSIKVLSDLVALSEGEMPDSHTMDVSTADQWLRKLWGMWLARQDDYEEL